MTQRFVRAFIVAALSGGVAVAAIKLSAHGIPDVKSPNGIVGIQGIRRVAGHRAQSA